MSRSVPALRMSNIIASDAPLSSPISESAPWDSQNLFSPTLNSFALPPYHTIPHQTMQGVVQPPSPQLSVRSMNSSASSHSIASPVPMLKTRLSPAADLEQQLCVPTHQLFGPESYIAPPLSSPSPEPVEDPPSPVVPAKRPSSSAGTGAPPSTSGTASASAIGTGSSSKKARSGERITTKDFIPPDVSGLSKREARLVKNRAAAFLSRQRKREEFETMELRVAELEQENARLLALAATSPAPSREDETARAEVERLRQKLAALEQRNAELARPQAPPETLPAAKVKAEPSESRIPAKGASLGLMVLLCALPTLLSMPALSSSTSTAAFSFPLNHHPSHSHSHSHSHSSSSHLNLYDYDWPSAMELDPPSLHFQPSTSHASDASAIEGETLSLEGEGLGGLGALDVEFEARRAGGKIRVRIHPPQASLAGSVPSSSASSISGGSTIGSPAPFEDQDEDPLGPFLGVGAGSNEYDMGGLASPDWGMLSMSNGLGMGMDTDIGLVGGTPLDVGHVRSLLSARGLDLGTSFDLDSGNGDGYGLKTGSKGRRRVRIALKSLPGEGREGGEWEVEVC